MNLLESVSDKKDFEILVRDVVLKVPRYFNVGVPFKTTSLTEISKPLFLSDTDSSSVYGFDPNCGHTLGGMQWL